MKRNRPVSFLRLLLAMLALFLIQPLITGTGRLSSVLLNTALIVVLATAAASISAKKIMRLAVYGSGVVAAVASAVGPFWAPAPGWLELTIYGSYLVFFTLVCANVLGHVLEGGAVDANKLYGVCCVYFLAGVAWAFLYAITDTLAPGSFTYPAAVDVANRRMPQLIYFSLVTLTTLGYGDVAPVSPFAQTAAALEAIFGQAYLAVLVARLVGMRSPGDTERQK